MKTKLWALALPAILLACQTATAADPTITLGTYTLQPNTANQKISIYVSGGTVIQGEDVVVQVDAGTSGPIITNVDLLTNTIFALSNTGQQNMDLSSYPEYLGHLWYSSTTTNGNDTALADGLLATITLDTTGMEPNQSFNLLLTNTLGGDTKFALLGGNGEEAFPTVNVGTLTIANVPEPASLSLLAGSLLLFQMRRRRR